ncbi:DFP-domain-containing protein [Basidiobolus meristosporus CBS 931.73]|uniref:DFP-domain-containing protein n=1 Tax=Basidiobolus meristosporus CBS 931.73 TaxID=1314790 RepID=A0A1Y1XUY0_9FUNG|nr:DFP-domain-containing protein [Basidiobolus meristosporus CBS 931.73]|eukprot:ORX89577.1 DFP-domain-containing protein [Basidiobolus meristosporus CBS 931.73]
MSRPHTPLIEPDEYFRTHAAPEELAVNEKAMELFVAKHRAAGRRIAVVTSGGTTVPLENQTVRFIDNFSAGTRGATSAEYPFYHTYFLELGYAVIFLHRQFSLQPYSRHYTHSKNCFLDYMGLGPDGQLTVDSQYSQKMKEVLTKYHKAKQEETLLMISFVTVTDYLFHLRSAAFIVGSMGEKALFYLAAAVSDFFIPAEKMVEHKIQSDGGGLTLTMEQVPKVLKPLVTKWASQSFIISFKLETDPEILTTKARRALNRYGHKVVIGNLLTTRKQIVWFITNDTEETVTLTNEQLAQGVEIESKIVPNLIERHTAFIESSGRLLSVSPKQTNLGV